MGRRFNEIAARRAARQAGTRYQTIARCVTEGCRCDDRAGVILYDGPDRAEAESAKRLAPAVYTVEVVNLEKSDGLCGCGAPAAATYGTACSSLRTTALTVVRTACP